MVLMTSKTSLQKWSGVFLFPSVSPVFFQIGTVTYQHRLRFRWRGFMYEFLPLIRSRGIVGQPCLDDVAFLTFDGFCAESGNLDVGVSDAKEFKSVVHEHFKAFFRK